MNISRLGTFKRLQIISRDQTFWPKQQKISLKIVGNADACFLPHIHYNPHPFQSETVTSLLSITLSVVL
jgi:hypothetical protein